MFESSKESSFVLAQMLGEVDEWSAGGGVALVDDAEELTRQGAAPGISRLGGSPLGVTLSGFQQSGDILV
jgi:hypothetical protein